MTVFGINYKSFLEEDQKTLDLGFKTLSDIIELLA